MARERAGERRGDERIDERERSAELTQTNGGDAAGGVGPGVPYEEWVSDVLGRLRGDEHESLAEAEEELLLDLDPVGEDDPSGLAGVPWYVVGDSDPTDRAKRLIHDLHAAAWRLPISSAADVPDGLGRPQIYESSDGESYGLAVGVHGPPEERRAAFEDSFDLRFLSCVTPADLRALHETVASRVGGPLHEGTPAARSAGGGEELRIFVGLDTFSHDHSDPLSSVAVFPVRYPQVFSDDLDDEEPEVEVVDDEGMTEYAEKHYDFWNLRIFAADGSYRVLPDDPGTPASGAVPEGEAG